MENKIDVNTLQWKVYVNTLQYAINTIKRQDKWAAVEELSLKLINELEKIE